jgi:hypothetical protein
VPPTNAVAAAAHRFLALRCLLAWLLLLCRRWRGVCDAEMQGCAATLLQPPAALHTSTPRARGGRTIETTDV